MQQNLTPIIISLAILPLLLLLLWRVRLKRLAIYHSPTLGKIEVLQKYNGEKILTINSYVQGISLEQESIQKSYWFAAAQKTVEFCRGKKEPQILVLGLGANTIPNLIAKLDPQSNQTIVEIDSRIIQACRDFFDLDKLPKHRLIQANAFSYFKTKKDNQYDVILVDIFTGRPPYISLESNHPDFIRQFLPTLKKEGMVIFNRPAHTEEVRTDGKKLESYLKTLFKKTQILYITDPRGFRNNLVAGQQKLT